MHRHSCVFSFCLLFKVLDSSMVKSSDPLWITEALVAMVMGRIGPSCVMSTLTQITEGFLDFSLRLTYTPTNSCVCSLHRPPADHYLSGRNPNQRTFSCDLKPTCADGLIATPLSVTLTTANSGIHAAGQCESWLAAHFKQGRKGVSGREEASFCVFAVG